MEVRIVFVRTNMRCKIQHPVKHCFAALHFTAAREAKNLTRALNAKTAL
jgi:hypothetical protein